MPDSNADFLGKLGQLLDDKGEKNYDPRMEELMRSDRLIDPKAENLSELENQEIFHIAKIRGMQTGFAVKVKRIQKIYNLPWMLDYRTDYIDYIRSLDPVKDKEEFEASIGGIPMTNEMIRQLIYLRPALEAKRAKLYADSIKPQVANVSPVVQQPEPQEGFFGKILNLMFGKKQEQPNQYPRR